ncbi:hypothetical protein AM1BK_36100 [Neobacillus kokaensis]|uniref:Uncharacterized protein n=1 Tax=Neobacillus kokaensis TaxID=2759023 RepID=A0ABQ3N5T7_9BACI|nr:hypothetical protein AM1BK_36100 [Neobacillus kokaensis]
MEFQIWIGNMDYKMDIDGILGFDFIYASKLVIDRKENPKILNKSLMGPSIGPIYLSFNLI